MTKHLHSTHLFFSFDEHMIFTMGYAVALHKFKNVLINAKPILLHLFFPPFLLFVWRPHHPFNNLTAWVNTQPLLSARYGVQ